MLCDRKAYAGALDDVARGLHRWELWGTLGWHDIRQRYRRSIVGPFWLTISMATMIAGLAYVYSGLFGQSIDTYLPYVAVGFIAFNFISSIILESCQVFIGSAGIILQTRAPLSVYIYQLLWRNVLVFAHNMIIFVVLIVLSYVKLSWLSLLALPALFLVVVTGASVGFVLGGISARFRDVPPIVASVMQIAFFLTPVFWLPEALGGHQVPFVDMNPFYYFLEIVRMPLLGQLPSLAIWTGAILFTFGSAFLSLLFFTRFRRRVPYWI